MRVLIAIDDHHRHHHDDSGAAVEGELVTPVIVGCADTSCEGCHGSWFGLVSHAPAPLAMVVDRPGVTEAALRSRVHGWLDCVGVVDRFVQAAEAGDLRIDGVEFDDPVTAVDELVTDHLAEIREICATYPVGTVVSRLGTLVAPRQLDRAA